MPLAPSPLQRFIRVAWPGVKCAVLRFRGAGGSIDNFGHYPAVGSFGGPSEIPEGNRDDWIKYMNGTWDEAIYGPRPPDYEYPNPDAEPIFKYFLGSETTFWFVNLKYRVGDNVRIGLDLSACFPIGGGTITSDLLLIGIKMTTNEATIPAPKTIDGVVGLFNDGSISKYEAPGISTASSNRWRGVTVNRSTGELIEWY